MTKIKRRITFDENGSEVLSIVGIHENFIVEIYNNSIELKGSLAKYLKGNNFDFLRADEIKEAFTVIIKKCWLQCRKGRAVKD